MEVLNTIKGWAKGLAEMGVSIAALLIVAEVLGVRQIPFLPDVSVVSNVSAMLAGLGAEGLMGLIAIWVLYQIWDNK